MSFLSCELEHALVHKILCLPIQVTISTYLEPTQSSKGQVKRYTQKSSINMYVPWRVEGIRIKYLDIIVEPAVIKAIILGLLYGNFLHLLKSHVHSLNCCYRERSNFTYNMKHALVSVLVVLFCVVQVNSIVYTKCKLTEELQKLDFPRSFISNCKWM